MRILKLSAKVNAEGEAVAPSHEAYCVSKVLWVMQRWKPAVVLRTQVLPSWEHLQASGCYCCSTHIAVQHTPLSVPIVLVPVLAWSVTELFFQPSVELGWDSFSCSYARICFAHPCQMVSFSFMGNSMDFSFICTPSNIAWSVAMTSFQGQVYGSIRKPAVLFFLF